jgi:hypothetical protein
MRRSLKMGSSHEVLWSLAILSIHLHLLSPLAGCRRGAQSSRPIASSRRQEYALTVDSRSCMYDVTM